MTVWGQHLKNHSKFIPHPKYPRPGMVRKGGGRSSSAAAGGEAAAGSEGGGWWLCLNGYWDYSVTQVSELALFVVVVFVVV
jgi:hypothetical protein